MLTRRYLRGPFWYDGRHSEAASIFRRLAARWRPLGADLRDNEAGEPDIDPGQHRKRLQPYWSPWLLIK